MIIIKRTILAMIFIVLSIGFSGCSTKFYKTSKGYKESMAKEKNIALVTDTCMYVDEIGDDGDHYSAPRSKKTLDLLNAVIENKLEKDGLNIGYIEDRTMCAFFSKKSYDINLVVAEDADVIKGELPYEYKNIDDTVYKKALKNILRNAFLSSKSLNINKGSHFEENFLEDETVLKSLKIIKDYTKQDKLLVVMNKGMDVSAGKQFAQGATTAILTLGMVTRYSMDYIDAYAILIDMNKEKAIWTASSRFMRPDLYDEDFYEDDYYEKILVSLEQNKN